MKPWVKTAENNYAWYTEAVFTLYGILFAPSRKPYRIGFCSHIITVISARFRSEAAIAPISKVESDKSDSSSYYTESNHFSLIKSAVTFLQTAKVVTIFWGSGLLQKVGLKQELPPDAESNPFDATFAWSDWNLHSWPALKSLHRKCWGHFKLWKDLILKRMGLTYVNIGKHNITQICKLKIFDWFSWYYTLHKEQKLLRKCIQVLLKDFCYLTENVWMYRRITRSSFAKLLRMHIQSNCNWQEHLKYTSREITVTRTKSSGTLVFSIFVAIRCLSIANQLVLRS